MTQNTKKAPTPAGLRETNAGASQEVGINSTPSSTAWEGFTTVKSGGLTKGKVSGNVRVEAENLSTKASRSLDTGIFYCVHAPKKHGVFTAIQGRVWANTIPFGEICPPFVDGFRYPAFFASCVRPKNEKIYEVKSCLN